MNLACSKLGSKLGQRAAKSLIAMTRMERMRAGLADQAMFNDVYTVIESRYNKFIEGLELEDGDPVHIKITKEDVLPTVKPIILKMKEGREEKVELIAKLYQWLCFYVEDKIDDKNYKDPDDLIEYNLAFINKVIVALEAIIIVKGTSFDSIMGQYLSEPDTNCLQEGPMADALYSVKKEINPNFKPGGARVETLNVSKNKRGITRSSKPIKFKNKSVPNYSSIKKNLKSIKNNSPKSIERQTSGTAQGLRRRRRKVTKRKGKRSKK
jgi:hypothetical protein